jgi:glucokinase
MRVLAGDIGGTKTLLQIADIFPNNFRVVFEQSFDSRHYPEFLPLAKEFLKQAVAQTDLILAGACFGVAGPVSGREARTTNLPWRIDADACARELKISNITLVNDFQAIGYGIEGLGEDDLVTLQAGKEVEGAPRVVIGAGTGLGEGILVWNGSRYDILPSEGGHADFAPTDELQIELWKFLRARHERVTYERVVSGPGLVNVYAFLRERKPRAETAELKALLAGGGDAAAHISAFALEKNDALANEALDLFCAVYGAQAGNLALTCLAHGGVYIGGGIAPKIINKLKGGGFMRAFRSKGRMAPLLEAMPVRVIMNPKVGLLGAALLAERMAGKKRM